MFRSRVGMGVGAILALGLLALNTVGLYQVCALASFLSTSTKHSSCCVIQGAQPRGGASASQSSDPADTPLVCPT